VFLHESVKWDKTAAGFRKTRPWPRSVRSMFTLTATAHNSSWLPEPVGERHGQARILPRNNSHTAQLAANSSNQSCPQVLSLATPPVARPDAYCFGKVLGVQRLPRFRIEAIDAPSTIR